jgi:hypothetical protein
VLTPEPVDTRPTQSLQEALAPATYRHPEANREALLDGVLVAYAFKRGKRRTIGFSVGAEGLAVSAPKWVLLNEIDRAVQEKAGWIVKKLQETRERHKRLEAVRIDWKDGASLPFLGGLLTVVLDPRQSVSAMMVQPVSAAADAGDDALAVEAEDGELVFLGWVAGEEALGVGENDAVRVTLHLRQGEETADAGHAVDIGNEDGALLGEEVGGLFLEESVRVFAGAHFE